MSNSNNISDSHWVKLSEVSVLKIGVLSNKKIRTNSKGSIPFITARDIVFNGVIKDVEKIPEEIIKELGVDITPKQSLVIAVSGPTAGNVAVLETDAVVDKVIYLSIQHNDTLNPKYLYYYLRFRRDQVIPVSRYPERVSFFSLSNLKIPIPAIKLQGSLIEQLEKQLNSSDILIKSVNEKLDNLKLERQAILQKTFDCETLVDVRDGIHHDYTDVVKIKECGIVQAGKTPNGSLKQYYGQDFPLFNTNAFQQGMDILTSKVYLSERGLKEAREFKSHSILVCNIGLHFGKAGIARIRGACNAQILSISLCKKVLPEFLYYQIISPFFQRQMLGKSNENSIGKIEFENLYVALPTIERQQSIVKTIDVGFSAIAKKEAKLQDQLKGIEMNKKGAFLKAFDLWVTKNN
jgi:restriction endonuclease S subunit